MGMVLLQTVAWKTKNTQFALGVWVFGGLQAAFGGLTRVAQALGDAVDGGMHHGQQLRVLRRLFQV